MFPFCAFVCRHETTETRFGRCSRFILFLFVLHSGIVRLSLSHCASHCCNLVFSLFDSLFAIYDTVFLKLPQKIVDSSLITSKSKAKIREKVRLRRHKTKNDNLNWKEMIYFRQSSPLFRLSFSVCFIEGVHIFSARKRLKAMPKNEKWIVTENRTSETV